MSSASEANALDVLVSPAVQQVLDAMQAAEINPEDALEISLVLLNFLQEYHVENLEELLADERPDPISIAVWAADSARLTTARQLLGEVLGEDEDEARAFVVKTFNKRICEMMRWRCSSRRPARSRHATRRSRNLARRSRNTARRSRHAARRAARRSRHR